MKYCRYCKIEFNDALNYCTACGVSLANTMEAVQEESTQAELEQTISIHAESMQAEFISEIPVQVKPAQAESIQAMSALKQPIQHSVNSENQSPNAPNAAFGEPPAIPKAPSHLIKAIIATIVCYPFFGIFGLIAVVYAARVEPYLRAHRFDDAIEASKKANLWSNLAIILWLLFYMLLWIQCAWLFRDYDMGRGLGL